MTRSEIVTRFRAECPEITSRVITNSVLYSWCEVGDKEICARTRCIVDKEGTTISTAEDDQSFDLTNESTRFYDIDEFPGGGVAYDDDRLEFTTIAELDQLSSSWRTRSSGTPKKYFRRGKWLWLDRPIDSDAEDLTVYSVLIPTDFDDDDKTPFDELSYLEPFHYSVVLYLIMRAKAKVGKREDALKAMAEYENYIAWMKKELGGGKFGKIYLRKLK